MRDEPTTPEGRLIRRYRKRQSPEPTIPELADRLGWSKEKLGGIERGHTSRNPDFRPSAEDLARIAAELQIPPEELDKTGTTPGERDRIGAAAEILRASPQAPSGVADPEALFVELVEALIARNPGDAETLRWLMYRTADGEGRPKPVAVRMRDVIDWIRDHAGADAARETG